MCQQSVVGYLGRCCSVCLEPPCRHPKICPELVQFQLFYEVVKLSLSTPTLWESGPEACCQIVLRASVTNVKCLSQRVLIRTFHFQTFHILVPFIHEAAGVWRPSGSSCLSKSCKLKEVHCAVMCSGIMASNTTCNKRDLLQAPKGLSCGTQWRMIQKLECGQTPFPEICSLRWVIVQYAESLCVKYCTYIKVYGCQTDGLIQEVIFLTVHVYILYPPPPTHTHRYTAQL